MKIKKPSSVRRISPFIVMSLVEERGGEGT
jgi:hypothetical protein